MGWRSLTWYFVVILHIHQQYSTTNKQPPRYDLSNVHTVWAGVCGNLVLCAIPFLGLECVCGLNRALNASSLQALEASCE